MPLCLVPPPSEPTDSAPPLGDWYAAVTQLRAALAVASLTLDRIATALDADDDDRPAVEGAATLAASALGNTRRLVVREDP